MWLFLFVFIICKIMSTRSLITMSKPDASMKLTYEELVGKIIKRYDTEFNTLRNQQLFIGIGGGPGSGKSTLSEEIVKMINEAAAIESLALYDSGLTL